MLTDRRRIPERGIASDGKHCHCSCHYVQGIIHFTPCCRPKQVDDLTATIQRALDAITSRVLAYRPKDKGVAATKMRDQIKKAERKAKREERE